MTDQNTPPPPAGWYRDPTGQGDARYWNGVAWTPSVSRAGVTMDVPVAESQLHLPPVPGSEYRVATPPPTYVPTPTQPAVQVTQSSGRSSGGAIGALVVAALAIVVLVIILVSVTGNDGDDDEEPTQDAPTEQPEEQQPDPPADEQAPAEG